jgi:hypothetical protein
MEISKSLSFGIYNPIGNLVEVIRRTLSLPEDFGIGGEHLT